MTMRVSEETKNKLESVKRLYHLDSLDSAVDYILEHPNAIRSKFYQYMRSLCGKYARWPEQYILYEDDDRFYIGSLFTEKHQYTIVADKDGGTMSCSMGTRAPEPGEDWAGSNGLAGGPFSKETLERIKSDILSCELTKLSTETLARFERDGIDTKSIKAKERAQLRIEQEMMTSECEEEVIEKPTEE